MLCSKVASDHNQYLPQEARLSVQCDDYHSDNDYDDYDFDHYDDNHYDDDLYDDDQSKMIMRREMRMTFMIRTK